MLSVQPEELVQKEQQKIASDKEIDMAEDQQGVSKIDLVEICQHLHNVSRQSSLLAKKKERLKLDMERKEINQEKISNAGTSKPSKELMREMVHDIRLSILDLNEDLSVLESEISEHTAKEEKMKEELIKKEKEADENKQALEDLKEKQKQELSKKEKEADENKQALVDLKVKQERFSSVLVSQFESIAEDIQQAEKRQEELNHVLQETHKSLQQLAARSADLAKEKEQLEDKISKRQKLKEKIISLVFDAELVDELVADHQRSIDDCRKRLEQVDMEIEEQRVEEKQLEEEAAEKEKDLDRNKQVVQELKAKHSAVSAVLEGKRKIFDCQLRQKLQSGEELQEERKVSAS